MRTYIGGHQAVNADDFEELALGEERAFWLEAVFGKPGESEQERQAREDAARDMLADSEHPELPEQVCRIVAEAIESRAAELFNVVPLMRPTSRRPRSRKGAAA
ncbi:hypothetical protein [Streptomyces indicus]|uniref:Uncharacterized protein n=1 Tax=Streptomyces indicus TaxID=417292 RepID=A0A1G9EU04_9ACTN|nr:hypothetical protein [Streptomyces indicus]SDK79629.1 hypothetical protein SAMN05421806_11262 [Streptomyces indicus]